MGLKDHLHKLSSQKHSKLAGYAFAILAVLIAFALRLVLVPFTGTGAPFVLFFGAVLASSYYGGQRPGFLAILLGGPLAGYFFVVHAGYSVTQAVAQVLMFAAESVLVILVTSAFLRSKAQAEQSACDAKQAMEEARRATQIRDDFIAVVSHDLKNPLTAIDLKASLLIRHPEPQASNELSVRKQAEAIKKSTQRMKRLIDDLLDLAKIESGRFSVEPVSHSVDALIDETLETFEPLADEKTIQLETVRCPESCFVLCDRDRIIQVLSNLIGNAIKFTAEGGLVSVRAIQQGNQIWFEVKDSGPGIPENQLPYVFDRYWQARQTARQGTGLGLSIARGIVEAHQGKIWAESRVGEGSTFIFVLPAAESAVLRIDRRFRAEATS